MVHIIMVQKDFVVFVIFLSSVSNLLIYKELIT